MPPPVSPGPFTVSPLTPSPLTNADRPRQQGPVFSPFERDGGDAIEHQLHWQDLLDRRLIGTAAPLSPELLAGVDAAERALRVGKYRWRA